MPDSPPLPVVTLKVNLISGKLKGEGKTLWEMGAKGQKYGQNHKLIECPNFIGIISL